MIVTFVQQEDKPIAHSLILVLLIFLGVGAVGMFFNLPFVKGPINFLQRRLLEGTGMVRVVDYELLLKVKSGYCVSDIEISEGHPMAGKALKESRPSDNGIAVLGIYHKHGPFAGAPNKDAPRLTSEPVRKASPSASISTKSPAPRLRKS